MELFGRLVPWDQPNPISGHERPGFAPNLLTLLFDSGLAPDDDPRIRACLESMAQHQAGDGRFLALGSGRIKASNPQLDQQLWAGLPCDHHAILEVLLRGGYVEDPRVRLGVKRLVEDLVATGQGPAWKCLPDPLVAFRGPGRKDDACPQVSLQALRVLSLLPPADRGDTASPARTILSIWRNRAEQRPYMFGHGRSFKEGKHPATWYSALAVVETLGRFPAVWSGVDAAPQDTLAMAELAACLRAYNIDERDQVPPHSVYTGFEQFSFGVRGRPSDFAAALVVRALHRLAGIAEAISAVDVQGLGSAKGGAGTARPPRVGV